MHANGGSTEEQTNYSTDSPLLKQEKPEENPVLLSTEEKRQQVRECSNSLET